jgi:hypothetical protein
MRYIKNFKESINNEVGEELYNMAITNMPYLMDKDFHVWYIKKLGNRDKTTFVSIGKIGHKKFKWSDVKYDYIPFIIQVNDVYEVTSISIILTQIGTGLIINKYNLDDIINDKIDDDNEITQINLYVKI